jgi:Holliday junction DNA helicase RuvA
VDGTAAVIDHEASGVARQVMLAAYLAERLTDQVGRPVTLHTMEYLESQGQGSSFVPRLIGFSQPQERRFFELFTSVKGLGNRKALRALAVPPAEIALMIAQKDPKALKKLPEIGARLAETMIAELAGKVEAFVDPAVEIEAKGTGAAPASRADPTGAIGEATEVLLALGQSQAEAEKAFDRALRGTETTPISGEEIVARVFGGENP